MAFALSNLWKVKDVRNRLFLTAGILILFRVISHIPLPNVNEAALRQLFGENQFFGLMNLFSGGGLSNLSIAMMGVGPYITASIIMQLLTMIVPKLERMRKEDGEAGAKKINQYTRLLTIPLAYLQGYGTISVLNQGSQVFGSLAIFDFFVLLTLVTAGSIFLMWLGELISEHGIGNGVSLIIFAGIIAGFPQGVQTFLVNYNAADLGRYALFGVAALILIAAVVLITEAQRHIPIVHARALRGSRLIGGGGSYLPLRVNMAGVIPIIFALSILLFPSIIGNLFSAASTPWVAQAAKWMTEAFQNQTVYGIVYFILVILFTYFYMSVTFEPHQIAENLQKSGSYVPGVRPGPSTADYLAYTANRITIAGALFLGIVAVMPVLAQQFTGSSNISIGGTSALIVVSVILETVKSFQAQLSLRDYDTLSG